MLATLIFDISPNWLSHLRQSIRGCFSHKFQQTQLERVHSSLNSTKILAMALENTEPTTKSKKPSDSAFKQQRLPAWQPILTAGTVLPTFFVIGIAFIPVGIGLLYFSDEVKELVIDYTNCNQTRDYNATSFLETGSTCANVIANNESDDCNCTIHFTLESDFKGKVYMYYGLSNFYQNHRRYVKSRDDYQLLGNLNPDPSADCTPFAKKDNKPIAPCGAIANSLFSDVLTLKRWENNAWVNVNLIRKGIAWDSDKNIKFKNPKGDNLTKAFEGYVKPIAWKKNVWELDPEDNENNGFQNEDLIVWMRTAALPTFRKLYRKIDHDQDGYKDGLLKGKYLLKIQYSYNVLPFEGSKRMILSTTSLLGGKNPFLGIAYIVVGCVCLLLGIVLLFIHIKCGKSTSEMINVNPRTNYQ